MTLPLFRRPPGADERQLSLLGWFLQEVREVYGLPTGESARFSSANGPSGLSSHAHT